MMKKTNIWLLSVLWSFILPSCQEYLDAKPDQSLAVPETLEDLQAILDYELYTILSYPASGDIASDYYYLNAADWEARREDARAIYVWDGQANVDGDWENSYKKIFYANVVLDHVQEAASGNLTEKDRNRIKGSALFLRGWNFYHLAQLFAPHYCLQEITGLPGIPIRLSSDINEKTERATLTETYERMIDDLEEAVRLLPDPPLSPTRPSRAAAYTGLARVYLVIGDYRQAGSYADSCLRLQDGLMDYNVLDTNAASPIPLFNEEVLFHATITSSSAVFTSGRAKVDSNLYSSYAENDLRKKVFFYQNGDGFSFKGNYTGNGTSGLLFSGLATDEVYLIKAESAARLGNVQEAMDVLNELLGKRWKKGTFVPLIATDSEEALSIILKEREKELAFRGGIRWSDLRRLNQEPRFSKTLTRIINDHEYELPPGDKRYTLLVPVSVVQQSGIQQNER